MSYHIIGDRDTILGFRFAGITGDAVETPEQAQEAFRRAISSLNQILGQDLIDPESVLHNIFRNHCIGK